MGIRGIEHGDKPWSGRILLGVIALVLAGVQTDAFGVASQETGPQTAATGREADEGLRRLRDEALLHLQEARQRQTLGDLAGALDEARRAVAVQRRMQDQEALAAGLGLLAELCETRGDFPGAVRASQERLGLLLTKPGADTIRVAEARQDLAHMRRLASAGPGQRRQVAQAQALLQSARTRAAHHEWGPAVRAAREALDLDTRILGEMDREALRALEALAELSLDKGDEDRAEPLCRRALQLRKQASGESSPTYVRNLVQLVRACEGVGKAEEARRLRAEVERHHPPRLCDPLADRPSGKGSAPVRTSFPKAEALDYAGSLHRLAGTFAERGDYARALESYEKVRTLYTEALGPDHPRLAGLLNDLAALLADAGDYAEAERLYGEALEIHRRRLGAQHPEYAATLHNLGLLFDQTGRADRAQKLLRQSVDILRQARGPGDPDYARGLISLGYFYAQHGRYSEAEPLDRQALAILQSQKAESRAYGQLLDNLGALYVKTGRWPEAERLLSHARDVQSRLLGTDHPDVADTLADLADLHGARKDFARALEVQAEALRTTRTNLRLASLAQSERRQLLMAAAMRGRLDAYLSLAVRAQAPGERVYDEVVRWKGSVFARRRHAWPGRPSAELTGLLVQLERTAGRITELTFQQPHHEKEITSWDQRVQAAAQEQDRLERALARLNAHVADETMGGTVAEQVRASLPADAVLLDYLEYAGTEPGRAPGKTPPAHRLVVFVVRPGRPVTMHDLGPVAPVAAAVETWREQVRRLTADSEPGKELRRRLLEPVAGAVQRARLVLVSPDGVLARLPFAALPSSRPGGWLVEEVPVAMVPVPRVLPQPAAEQLGQNQERTPGTRERHVSLLLVGDVAFGEPGRKVPGPATRSAGWLGSAIAFPSLPATRGEILAVRDSFEARHPDGWAQTLRGTRATKDAVVQELTRHRYVHLATHGYFAPPDLRSALEKAGGGRQGSAPGEAAGPSGLHPGLLSGLALANANEQPARGILTALEAADLDLRGIELATLSACETGLGESAGGEGVLGLQRAFQLAGARSVLASLWKVDDEATRRLMEQFYLNLWQKRFSKAEALRQAQLDILRQGPGRGLDAVDDPLPAAPRPAAPYSWAAFVLSGDWR